MREQGNEKEKKGLAKEKSMKMKGEDNNSRCRV